MASLQLLHIKLRCDVDMYIINIYYHLNQAKSKAKSA